jgi:hypothetical protein
MLEWFHEELIVIDTCNYFSSFFNFISETCDFLTYTEYTITMSEVVRPPEDRRSDVLRAVPVRLTQELERRAESAFSYVVDALMRQYCSQPPPRAEMEEFRRRIDAEQARVGLGGSVDLGRVLDQYTEDNPNSVIARYSRYAGGSTEWLTNSEGTRVQFRSTMLELAIRERLSEVRQGIVSAVSRGTYFECNLGSSDVVLQSPGTPDISLGSFLTQQLTARFREPRTFGGEGFSAQLNTTISYNPNTHRLFVSPPQVFDFR